MKVRSRHRRAWSRTIKWERIWSATVSINLKTRRVTGPRYIFSIVRYYWMISTERAQNQIWMGNHWGHRTSRLERTCASSPVLSAFYYLVLPTRKRFSFNLCFLHNEKNNIFSTCWMTVNWPENLTGNSTSRLRPERERRPNLYALFLLNNNDPTSTTSTYSSAFSKFTNLSRTSFHLVAINNLYLKK